MSTRLRRAILVVVLGTPLGGAAGPTPIWSDEFALAAGAGPDAARWVHDLGSGGWGNNELQTYTAARENSFITADPDALDGRALAIRAMRSPAGGYTSARLKSQGKFSLTYGRVEARMKLTRGRGVWPAFWMLGASIPTVGWPACGEIDIMEQVGHAPGKLHGTVHGPGYSGPKGISGTTELAAGAALSDSYHVYAVDWSPKKITWSLDGRVYFVLTPSELPAGTSWVFDAPMFLLLNLAVGGDWPGSPDATTTFPQTLFVDYIRVYGPPAHCG